MAWHLHCIRVENRNSDGKSKIQRHADMQTYIQTDRQTKAVAFYRVSERVSVQASERGRKKERKRKSLRMRMGMRRRMRAHIYRPIMYMYYVKPPERD
jgi:hypothetical protein